MRLYIAEKKDVGKAIASVLGGGKESDGFIQGKDFIVSWCMGHLIREALPNEYDPEKYGTWKMDTLPVIPNAWKTVVEKGAKGKQFDIINKLVAKSEVTEIVCATDADREGELIFRLVYEKTGCKKPVNRLWINNKEPAAIERAIATMKPSTEYNSLYYAALCRSRADWLVGMNMTMLYSLMYNKTLHIGRVQTPTINLLVKRQREIENFVPQTYYQLAAACTTFRATLDVTEQRVAQEMLSRSNFGTAYVTKVERTAAKENAPKLYTTSSLQKDANRFFGMTAEQTLEAAQGLYDKALTSYPRADSSYITSDMVDSTDKILRGLFGTNCFPEEMKKAYDTSKIDLKKQINDKDVAEAGHHAIIPTQTLVEKGIPSTLSESERLILLMIIYRLAISCYAPHLYQRTTVILDVEGVPFTAHGRQTHELGFKAFEDFFKNALHPDEDESKKEREEQFIPPDLQEGTKYERVPISLTEKQTSAPRPYTEADLITAMEHAGKNISNEHLQEYIADCGLATPATRASIIKKIKEREFVVAKGKSLYPTEKAITLMDLLPEELKEPDMTAVWESKLSEIKQGKLTDVQFMEEIQSFIATATRDHQMLYDPESARQVFKREFKPVGKCPKCGKTVYAYDKAYSCESGKNGCGFVIWKQLCGKKISESQAKALLELGTTPVIKGFTSKAGKKFDARLVFKEDFTIGFDFQERKKAISRSVER